MPGPQAKTVGTIDGTGTLLYCSAYVSKGQFRPGFAVSWFQRWRRALAVGVMKKFWLLWTALGAVVLGFVTLAAGMLTVGPVLLVLGYCVLLPFFLWRSFQESVGE